MEGVLVHEMEGVELVRGDAAGSDSAPSCLPCYTATAANGHFFSGAGEARARPGATRRADGGVGQ